MTIFSCLQRQSWILAAILEKKILQKYSHNSSIIPINIELSNFKTKIKVLTPSAYTLRLSLRFWTKLSVGQYVLTKKVAPLAWQSCLQRIPIYS